MRRHSCSRNNGQNVGLGPSTSTPRTRVSIPPCSIHRLVTYAPHRSYYILKAKLHTWDSLGLQAVSRLPEELCLRPYLKLLENPPAKETPCFLLVLPAGSA